MIATIVYRGELLEQYFNIGLCCAGCSAIILASGPASGSTTFISTPGSGATAITTLGQTFTTGGECVILSSFTLPLVQQLNVINNPVFITALLYTYDLSTNQVTGSRLASQATSATPSQISLTVTFPQPVQLSPATSYAIVLTTSGLGQGSTSRSIQVERSNYGNPNEIPGGKLIYQNNGDDPAAIDTSQFTQVLENLVITVN